MALVHQTVRERRLEAYQRALEMCSSLTQKEDEEVKEVGKSLSYFSSSSSRFSGSLPLEQKYTLRLPLSFSPSPACLFSSAMQAAAASARLVLAQKERAKRQS